MEEEEATGKEDMAAEEEEATVVGGEEEDTKAGEGVGTAEEGTGEVEVATEADTEVEEVVTAARDLASVDEVSQASSRSWRREADTFSRADDDYNDQNSRRRNNERGDYSAPRRDERPQGGPPAGNSGVQQRFKDDVWKLGSAEVSLLCDWGWEGADNGVL